MTISPTIKSLNPKIALVEDANVTETGQSLVDITGLSIELQPRSVYEIEAHLSVGSGDTNGNEYGVEFSEDGATVEAQISGTLTATTHQSARVSALDTATIQFMKLNGSGAISIHGIIETTTYGGNLTIKHLKHTSGTSTVYIGSFLKAKRIARH